MTERTFSQIQSELQKLGRVFQDEETVAKCKALEAELLTCVPNGGENAGVTTLENFRDKYGVLYPWLLVYEFMKLSPEFPQRNELGRKIAVLMADLESVRK